MPSFSCAGYARRRQDRRRPHAQPADDRPAGSSRTEGDRGAHAGRQDVLRDGRRHGVPGRVGRLLAEIQRIKSEGDYPAAKTLFETYGVHFDPTLRDQIVSRVAHLNMPSYTGFVQPKLVPKKANDGSIADVTISYPMDLTAQMLEYSGRK